MKSLFLIIISCVTAATAIVPFEGIANEARRFPDLRCKPGTPSRCSGNGYQSCVGGRWKFTPCPFPSFCLPFPVAGAGVACSGAPCSPGTPSKCVNDGYEACVNGEWAFTRCAPPSFCLPFPVAGAGVACSGAPSVCTSGTPSECINDGFQTCVNGQWVFTRCAPPGFCLPLPVAGAGVACSGPPNGG